MRARAPRIVTRQVSPEAIAALSGARHPVLRRVLAARRVEPSQLAPAMSDLAPVGTLPGVEPAVERLLMARVTGERVVVVGDFDADGATATAVVVTCLRAFGYPAVDFLVPSRFRYGYGLSPPVAAIAAAAGPGLLLTVDNGITSIEGVRHARKLGLDVIVTDHHLPGTELPEAILVGPSVPGSQFASPALCGAGVAFYLMAALGRRLAAKGLAGESEARRAVTDCLDLVALGTVADLVPLDFNNRILVAEGLRRLRAGRSRPGLLALFEVAGRDPAQADAGALGYAIAPRLNAAGRLEDMTQGIECLLSADPVHARRLAVRLDELNRERRELQARMEEEARALLDSGLRAADEACLFDERWHEGIVGLVASRIREQTGRPAIAFARAGEAGLLKGSARSIPGVHVRDAIAEAVARLEPPAPKFGGHAMAAGITIAESQLPLFRRAFAAALERHREALHAPELCLTDGPLAADDMGLDLAEALAGAGPWGQAFPEPLFDNRLLLLEQRVVGSSHLRLRLRHPDGPRAVEAVAFHRAPLARSSGDAIRCVYRLAVNAFRGARRAELVVEHLDCD